MGRYECADAVRQRSDKSAIKINTDDRTTALHNYVHVVVNLYFVFDLDACLFCDLPTNVDCYSIVACVYPILCARKRNNISA